MQLCLICDNQRKWLEEFESLSKYWIFRVYKNYPPPPPELSMVVKLLYEQASFVCFSLPVQKTPLTLPWMLIILLWSINRQLMDRIQAITIFEHVLLQIT
jgi:hypothetical protein